MNDAYLEAWNLIPPHKPENYLFAFLGRIVRNIALNECKKQQRQKRSAVYCELTQEMQECLPSPENMQERLEAEELSGIINSFLKTCSEEQQKVFVRRYWYFDPISKIAKDYGYSQSKVKTMLFRMRSELKEYLEKGGYSI